eukprot:2397792-Rhodomonas_salina.1
MVSLPVSENVVAGHVRHTKPAVAFRNVPAACAVRDPNPCTFLYEPTEQPLHAVPSEPSYPMLEMQSEIASDPDSESVNVGQVMQADLAVASRYVPTVHIKQLPAPFTSVSNPIKHQLRAAPSEPLFPTLQMQAVIASLPTSETVSPGHVTHNDPAVTFGYLPASESEHVPDPYTPLCVLTVHAEHADPSTASYRMLQMQPAMAALLVSENVLAGHVRHTRPAVTFRHVPAAHSVLDPGPFTSLYEPAKRPLHAAPSEPSYPMLEMQSEIASDP